MNDPADFEEGRALWRRVRPAAADRPPVVDPLELAAWLDGTLDERTQARVDAAMLADPRLLDSALAIRDGLNAPALDAERLAVRARALIAPQEQTAQAGASWWAVVFAPRRLQWAALAAAFVVAGFGGFRLGDSMAQEMIASDGSQPAFVYGMPLNDDPLAGNDDDEA